MKPIAIIAIIAAVVVVGGACAGVAFSGVLNGGTTGPGGDDPVVPTDPVDPTPTETPTETPTPTPTDSSMSYFSPMTSSGSSSSGGSNKPVHVHTYSGDLSKNDTHHWYAATCEHTDEKKDEVAHTIENVEAKDPTCTEAGYTAGDRCSICGYVQSGLEETQAIGHTEVIDDAVDATCTEPGLTEGKHCSVCGEVLVAQTVVAAHHTYAEAWIYDETNHWHAATCEHSDEKDGIAAHEYTMIQSGDQVCMCGYSKSASVSVGTVTDLQNILNAILTNGGTGDVTVTLTQDIDVASNWDTLAVPNTAANITIDGDGHTIKNLNKPLVTGLWGGYGTLTFKNMTIEDAKIEGYNAANVGGTLSSCGAFMAYADAATKIIMDNCHLKSSIVNSESEFTGGLIGYSSAPIEINNCSVTDSTITSGKSAGAIIGQDAAAGEMDKITVTGCTISSTGVDEGKKYCGTIVGTSNAAASVYTNVQTSGNTINDVSSETYYGRAYVGLSINGTEYVQ